MAGERINAFPDAPTPYTGAEAAIGTGADGVTTYQLLTGATAALAANQQSVATFAALRALTTLSGGPGAIVVRSRANPGDGGGGVFVYDAADTTTADNGGTILVPTATLTGRWYRLYSGALDIRWFGGVADWNGTTGTDNLPALTAAVASITHSSGGSDPYAGGPRILYPAAALSYWHSGTYFFKKAVILEGETHGFPVFSFNYSSTLVFPANLGTPALKFERFNTLNNVIIAPTTTGADGSIVRNLAIVGAGTPTYDGVSHGLDTRCRIFWQNVSVYNFGGHGAQILANSGGTGPTQGNANEWRVDTLNCTDNLGDAFHVEGSDANGGTSTGFGCLTSGLSGLKDITFLGNTHIGPHIDNCNSLGRGLVNNGGNSYLLINDTPGIGASTTPGTNSTIWAPITAGSYPAWSGAGTYQVAAAIYSNNANARSVFVGVYLEGNTFGHVQGPSMVLGGSTQTQFTTFTPFLFQPSGIGSFLATQNGVGGFEFLPAGDARGTYAYSYISPLGLVMQSQAGSASGWLMELDPAAPGDLVTIAVAGAFVQRWGSAATVQQYGTGAAVPFATWHYLLEVGDGTTTQNNARAMRNGTAAPTTGAHAQGEIVWNRSCAAAGQVSYWQCTVAGTPGTWVAHNL